MKTKSVQAVAQKEDYNFGDRVVRIWEDTTGNPFLFDIKLDYSRVLNALNSARTITDDGERKRQLSIAITNTEVAFLCAKNAVTHQY